MRCFSHEAVASRYGCPGGDVLQSFTMMMRSQSAQSMMESRSLSPASRVSYASLETGSTCGARPGGHACIPGLSTPPVSPGMRRESLAMLRYSTAHDVTGMLCCTAVQRLQSVCVISIRGAAFTSPGSMPDHAGCDHMLRLTPLLCGWGLFQKMQMVLGMVRSHIDVALWIIGGVKRHCDVIVRVRARPCTAPATKLWPLVMAGLAETSYKALR